MNIREYHKRLRSTDTDREYVGWLNDMLSRHQFFRDAECPDKVTIPAYRSWWRGYRTPPLKLAIALSDISCGGIAMTDWPGITPDLAALRVIDGSKRARSRQTSPRP